MPFIDFEKAKIICTHCKKETENLIIGSIYRCPNCGDFWGSTETLYECTREGCENIFVFEDDAKFHKGFNERVDKYLNELPTDWDMILFYSFMYQLLLCMTLRSLKNPSG